MTCDGRNPGLSGWEDVKVTNDDDDDEENRRDDDEACNGNGVQSYCVYVCVCVCVLMSCSRLEAIRICGGPLLGFFGRESRFTHPAQHSATPPRSVLSMRDPITTLNYGRNNGWGKKLHGTGIS